jgi:tRNA threonylcarbamoyladenosine biosynthesis protein TsaB
VKKPFLVMAWDTATPWCAAALVSFEEERETVLAEFQGAEGPHSRILPPQVARMLEGAGLAPADLDLLAVGRGPGSFTGLRTGLALAQGWSFGAGIPLMGLPTLDVLADLILEEAGPEGENLAAPLIDARHKEVFTAVYEAGPAGPALLRPPLPVAPAALLATLRAEVPDRPFRLAGPALNLVRECCADGWPKGFAAGPENLIPRAARLARLARQRFLADSEAARHCPPLPLYIRQPDIRTTGLVMR